MSISLFVKSYCKKYGKSEEEVMKIWKSTSLTKTVVEKTCIHIWGKTSNKHGEKCGAKVCEDSKTQNYCKKHLGNEKKTSKNTISELLLEKIPRLPIQVKKNSYGNYVDNNNLVFDEYNNRVRGYQQGDIVIGLSEEKIELCKSLNYQYDIPRTIVSEAFQKDEKKIQQEKEIISDDETEESDTEEEKE